MPDIWLDVTTILHWGRPAVGIVRVESECAYYFLECATPDVRFCRFDLKDQQYFEVSRAEVSTALARIRSGIQGGRPPLPQVATKEQRFKEWAIRFMQQLPAPMANRVMAYARKREEAYYALVRAFRDTRAALKLLLTRGRTLDAAAITPQITKPIEPRKSAPFGTGDVYITLGLDWDQKDLEYLFAAKRRLGFRVLMMCYDVIPVKHQELYYNAAAAFFARYFTDLAWTADEVMCISECSRRDLTDLLRQLGAPVPPMSVIRLGSELPPAAHGEPSSEVARIAGNRFILFVSTIERRKNHEVLYRAYTRLVDAGLTDLPLLVFVGMPGWRVSDLMLDLQLDPRIEPYVRTLHDLSDADLRYLFQHAAFTVFPSLYEGWGLPVAESLGYGRFCLASNAASIPEVGGDLIEYLDPWDLPAWTERLKWYFDHPEEIARKEERIRKEYRPVPWSDTAAFVLTTAQRLCAGDSARSA